MYTYVYMYIHIHTCRCRYMCIHESESHSVVSDSLQPMDYTIHGIPQARILEWAAFPFSRGSSQPSDQTQVSHIAGSSPAEPLGKPKNTGMSSLSLLQGIFPTQELNNRGLLHCRRILYQLSYQDFLTTRPFFLVRSPKPQ